MLVFFENILVCSLDLETHVTHLAMVFNVPRDNKLYTNLTRFEFAKERIEYLSHCISTEGVEANPDKIMAMLYWSI